MTSQHRNGPERYRVDELAALGGISVELLRSYQSRGLLPAPTHEGRVAWYDGRHLARLRRIRDLKAKGWSIRAIAATLDDGGHGLRATVEAATDDGDDEQFDLPELAERTGLPVAVLRSFIGSGVLRPRQGPRRWAEVLVVLLSLPMLELHRPTSPSHQLR